MKKLYKIVLLLLSLLLIIPSIGFGYIYFKLNSMYDKEEAKEIQEVIPKVEVTEETNHITNILLVGIDGNNIEGGSRSDSMIIATIDEKNNDIRLTSLARDTYVQIPGRGQEKLTHAYAYGGASLLLQTINENFNIPIDKYVAVSFDSFVKMIDVLGGVEIDVLSKEVSHITGINSSGTYNLTGSQALEYSRIRYADNAYERDQRQRNVIEALFEKFLSDLSSNFIPIGEALLSYTKTNVYPKDIFTLLNKVKNIKDSDFEQLEFPLEEYRTGTTINQSIGWVIQWDKEQNLNALNNFIYGK